MGIFGIFAHANEWILCKLNRQLSKIFTEVTKDYL